MPNPRPTLRLLTHLACTGGTVISRALDAMPGTVIASEVHPLMGMRRRANPYKQLQLGYGLIDDDDLTRVFTREMAELNERCTGRGMAFIVRDHTHADFVEPGFARRSPVWLRTNAALESQFELRSLVTVRHPIDQYLSLRRNKWLDCDIPQFVERLLAFSEHARATAFERYEDFADDPDAALRRMCSTLDIRFDPAFRDRLSESGRHLTGASGRQSAEIAPRPRPEVDPKLLERFARAPGYEQLLDRLGYLHPAGVLAAQHAPAA